MDDIYKNIEEYNPNKKRKILIVFDDMIADMLSSKKPNPIVTESFIRRRKLNIYFGFITVEAVTMEFCSIQQHFISNIRAEIDMLNLPQPPDIGQNSDK